MECMEDRAINQKKYPYIHLHQADNVVIVLRPVAPGETLQTQIGVVLVKDQIPTGHKLAVITIPQGGMVIKYGEEIGEATTQIEIGQHVHVHSVRDITAEVSERERKRLGI